MTFAQPVAVPASPPERPRAVRLDSPEAAAFFGEVKRG